MDNKRTMADCHKINQEEESLPDIEQGLVLPDVEEEKSSKEQTHEAVQSNAKRRCVTEEFLRDPVVCLPEKALALIFWFAASMPVKKKLVAVNEDGEITKKKAFFIVDPLKAGRYYASLCTVSSHWRLAVKQLFGTVMEKFSMTVDLSLVPPDNVFSYVSWLIKYKFHLIRLRFESYRSDYRLLSLLLECCNTDFLFEMKATTHNYTSNHWVPENDPLSEILLKEPLMSHRHFQDKIAEQCPVIKDLSIHLAARCNGKDAEKHFISPLLFSSANIATLTVSFSHFNLWHEDIDEYFFSTLIQGLTSLENLILVDRNGNGAFRDRGVLGTQEKMFVIKSPSLVTLDVTDYRRAVSFACEECPRLKEFFCKGIMKPFHYGDMVFVFQRVLDEDGAPLLKTVSCKNVSEYFLQKPEWIVMTRRENDRSRFIDEGFNDRSADHEYWL